MAKGGKGFNVWSEGNDVSRRLSFAPACFIIADEFSKKLSGVEVCEACEVIAGDGSMEGCQKLGGLWRLYPKTVTARNILLVKGIVLRGMSISVMDRNPYLLNQQAEGPTVKITIGNCPHSIANSEIEKSLRKIDGLNLMSKIFDQNYRRDNGELTTWKSGRRFAYVSKPSSPLPPTFEVGSWSATLYHFGQPKPDFNKSEENQKFYQDYRRRGERQKEHCVSETDEEESTLEQVGTDRKEREEGIERRQSQCSGQIGERGESQVGNERLEREDSRERGESGEGEGGDSEEGREREGILERGGSQGGKDNEMLEEMEKVETGKSREGGEPMEREESRGQTAGGEGMDRTEDIAGEGVSGKGNNHSKSKFSAGGIGGDNTVEGRSRSRVRSKSDSPRHRGQRGGDSHTPSRKNKRLGSDDALPSPSNKLAKHKDSVFSPYDFTPRFLESDKQQE